MSTVHQCFRIVVKLPNNHGKYYFERDIEEIKKGIRVVDSKITHDIGRAHRFCNADSAMAYRNRFRSENPGCHVFLEDREGNGPLFETRSVEPPSSPTGEDTRKDMWFEPDGFEHSGIGFLIKPATLPDLGRCYCVRARDIPSMADRTDIETVYAPTPTDAIERALALWGNLAQPSRAPWFDAQDAAQARAILQEYEQSKRGPGRLRPGDCQRSNSNGTI